MKNIDVRKPLWGAGLLIIVWLVSY